MHKETIYIFNSSTRFQIIGDKHIASYDIEILGTDDSALAARILKQDFDDGIKEGIIAVE